MLPEKYKQQSLCPRVWTGFLLKQAAGGIRLFAYICGKNPCITFDLFPLLLTLATTVIGAFVRAYMSSHFSYAADNRRYMKCAPSLNEARWHLTESRLPSLSCFEPSFISPANRPESLEPNKNGLDLWGTRC